MRIGLLGAALSLCLVGLCSAQTSHASIRKDLNVPVEDLSPALQQVATTYELQILYPTQIAKDLKTHGAVGTLTSGEALKAVLSGTGLSYKYLDANTVTVFAQTSNPPAGSEQSSQANQTSGQNAGGGKNPSQDFRVAQVDRTSTGSQVESSEQNLKEDKKFVLQEVVVTAQKREERLQNVPISIAVLGGDTLDKSTAAGVTDALNTVPGVATTVDYGGGGTLVTVRGVAAASAELAGSSPIAFYLDSVPFGMVKEAGAPDEDVYDLQRIEVLRGPQGTLYGASALNGVVRILTNDADLTGFDFKARVSDSDTDSGGNNYRGDMAVNVPIVQDKLAVRAVVGYENDSGWIDKPNQNDANDAELRNLRLKINALPTDDLSIGASVWRSRDTYGAPSTGYTYDKNSSSVSEPIDVDFDTYGLKIGYRIDGYSLLSETSYLDYTNDSYLDYAALLGGPFTVFTGLDSNVFAQEMLLNSPQIGQWRWSIGGMYRRATESLYQNDSLLAPTDPSGFIASDDATSKSYAVFGQVTRSFLDGLYELTLGVRQFEDHVTQVNFLTLSGPPVPADANFHATSPRAILTWHPAENMMVYGSYSQGFRSGFPQNAAAAPADLPPLQADKLNNYEIGAKGSLWQGRVSYDSAVYYIDWKNVQQFVTVNVGGLPYSAFVNGSSASGVGIDFGLSIRPTDNLTFGISASWNNLEMDGALYSAGVLLFSRGDRLNYSPETTAAATAEYVTPLGGSGYKARVSASANYTSSQDLRTVFTTQAIGTGDAMFFARAGLAIEAPKHWSATLFIDNLTNNHNSPIIPPYGVPDWDSRVRPRTVGLQLDYHLH
jgi:iron complex outermembrane recepter protein